MASDGEELESMIAKIRADLAASDDGRALVGERLGGLGLADTSRAFEQERSTQ